LILKTALIPELKQFFVLNPGLYPPLFIGLVPPRLYLVSHGAAQAHLERLRKTLKSRSATILGIM